MSNLQRTYVDYRNLGDTGIDDLSSIQPVTDGESAGQATFRRPEENLRARTEAIRSVFADLLYYRDRTAYVMELATGGELTWQGVGGSPAGRLNNTTQLTLRPFLAPNTKLNGFLEIPAGVGTAGLRYDVGASAYATEGVNAITVEHRSVTGTATLTCAITDGPVYRIIVVYDSANVTHTGAAAQVAVTNAIAVHPVLAGKITCSVVGTGSDVLAAQTEVAIDQRVYAGGVDGQPTVDAEAHTIPANYLNTFTTANPLQEGDILAIRYDYVIEPDAGDPGDPKGVLAGGRAESSIGRGTSDVSANLFLVRLNPEFVPGSIPLARVVGDTLRFIDGTSLLPGTSGVPGASIGGYIDATQFSGVATMSVNGGIDNNPVTVSSAQAAFESVDQRLSESRYRSVVVTDDTTTFGGTYSSSTAVTDAINHVTAATGTGAGTIVVRNGSYTGVHAGISVGRQITLEGESRTGTTINLITYQVTAWDYVFRDLTFTHSAAGALDFTRSVSFERVTFPPNTFTLGGAAGTSVSLKDCAIPSGVSVGASQTHGVHFNAQYVHVMNCVFGGLDANATAGSALVELLFHVREARFENCDFTIADGYTLLAMSTTDGNITFSNCRITSNSASSYPVDLGSLPPGFVGTLTFDNCIIENTADNPVVSATHTSGRVVFRNCRVKNAGTVNASPTLQTCFDAMPVTAGSPTVPAELIIENVRIDVGQTSFTGQGAPVVSVLAGSGGTDRAKISVHGLAVSLTGGAPALFAGFVPVMRIGVPSEASARAGCFFSDITFDVQGVPAIADTVVLACQGVSYDHPVYVTGLNVVGIEPPTTDNTSWCALYTEYAHIQGLYTTHDGAPSTNKGSASQYQLFGSVIENADLVLFSVGTNARPVQIHGNSETTKSYLVNSRVYAIPGFVTTGLHNLWADAAVLDGVHCEAIPGLPMLITTTKGGVDVRNCVIDTPALTDPAIDGSASSCANVRICDNRIIMHDANGANPISISGTTDNKRIIITGNMCLNTLAGALTIVCSTTGNIVADNLLVSNVSDPY